MKCLQGKKRFDIRIVEKEIPVPEHNQVLLKVCACGICGTDLHFLTRKETYTPLGHEIAAMVVAVGESVTRAKAGDMVSVEDLTACGTCVFCKSGFRHLCRNMTGLSEQSGMGEYLCVHENNLVLCNGLTQEQAALVEPSAAALSACLKAEIPEGGTVAVWGLGPIALLCIPLAKYYHAKKVVCIGSRRGTRRNPAREKVAKQLGADAVYYSEEPDFRKTMPENIRSVIVTSPPSTVPAAVETAGYGSTIVVLGVSLGGNACATVDVDDMVFGKKNLLTMLAEPACYFPQCVELIRQGTLPVEKLLTHTIRLTDVEGFRDLYDNDREVVKGIVINQPKEQEEKK